MNCKTCNTDISKNFYVVVPWINNMKLCLLCWGHFQDEYFSLSDNNE